MTGLIRVGLVLFAALGILIGDLVGVDAVGPAMGGVASLLALLGGTWFPITSGALFEIGRWLPSYWLVQANHVSVGGGGWDIRVGCHGRVVDRADRARGARVPARPQRA